MAFDPIDPRTLAACKAVYLADDASTLDLDGDLVTQWRPVSGYASGSAFTHFTPNMPGITSGNATVNGRNVLENSVVAKRGLLGETVADNGGNQVTIHMAMAIDLAPDAEQYFFTYRALSTGRPQHYFGVDGLHIQLIGTIPYDEAPVGEFFILSIQHSATSNVSRVAINGKVVLTQSTTTAIWSSTYAALWGDENGADSFVGRMGALVFFDSGQAATDEEFFGIAEWLKARYGLLDSPYSGLHTVTNLDNVADPNCIYFEQGVKIGDTFSFKETSEINGWGVSIDADGYPIIDSQGGAGADSFLFDIDKGAGFVNPGEWTFVVPYYVDTINGSSGNNGLTPETAFKSIQNIWGSLPAGDHTIYCTGGEDLISGALGNIGSATSVTVEGNWSGFDANEDCYYVRRNGQYSVVSLFTAGKTVTFNRLKISSDPASVPTNTNAVVVGMGGTLNINNSCVVGNYASGTAYPYVVHAYTSSSVLNATNCVFMFGSVSPDINGNARVCMADSSSTNKFNNCIYAWVTPVALSAGASAARGNQANNASPDMLTA